MSYSDNPDSKQGVEGVCTFINNKVSEFVKGKELPLSKSLMMNIASWAGRLRQKYASGHSDS